MFYTMLKRLFTIGIILVTFNVASAQKDDRYEVLDEAKLIVTYNLIYRDDSTNLEIGKQEDVVLLIGNEVSCFQSYLYYREREFCMTREPGTSIDVLFEQGVTPSDIRYRIYKNYPKGKMSVMERVPFTGYFEYVEDVPDFGWEITEDTMHIDGYLAQKATCQYGGRTWEAWFTEELPFSDGPYKFCGLPGLILNMIDSKKDYRFYFQFIEMPDKGVTIKWENKETVKTTKKGLFKVIDQAAESVMRNFDEHTSSEAQKSIYYGIKSRNNPIELDRK